MITVDPNLRGCGVAGWLDGRLLCAEYVKNPAEGRKYEAHATMALAVNKRVIFSSPVIIEMPRVYPGMPKTDLNDLLDVCGVGAAIATCVRQTAVEVITVFPSEWKGNLPKQDMLKRIWSKLTEAERAVVQKTNKSDTEDILDAVGIGLWKLGRLNARVFPGAV